MSEPIPLWLLGDEATVRPYDTESDYKSHYLEPVAYTRVRLDTAMGATDSPWADEADVDAVLFVDAVNSSPAKAPSLRDKVEVVRGSATWSGTVRRVRECIDEGSHIHHWEVGLGR